jgi:hypothetical protein
LVPSDSRDLRQAFSLAGLLARRTQRKLRAKTGLASNLLIYLRLLEFSGRRTEGRQQILPSRTGRYEEISALKARAPAATLQGRHARA